MNVISISDGRWRTETCLKIKKNYPFKFPLVSDEGKILRTKKFTIVLIIPIRPQLLFGWMQTAFEHILAV